MAPVSCQVMAASILLGRPGHPSEILDDRVGRHCSTQSKQSLATQVWDSYTLSWAEQLCMSNKLRSKIDFSQTICSVEWENVQSQQISWLLFLYNYLIVKDKLVEICINFHNIFIDIIYRVEYFEKQVIYSVN